MRTIIVLGAILGLMITPLKAVSAPYQQNITYTSGFHIQNLSVSQNANITVVYYAQEHGIVAEVPDVIPPAGSVTYARIHNWEAPGEPSSFMGSVVVISNAPVAAIVNTLGDFPSYASATTAFSKGSTSFFLPLIMCNNNGFDTWFNVQNMSLSDSTTLDISYSAGLAGQDYYEQAVIDPGQSKTFNQALGSDTVNCETLAGTDDRFVGSAMITSQQPVVATVMQVNSTDYKIMLGYNGFDSGGSSVRAPLVMANNNGFYTGLQVQNAGTMTTTVTVAYSNNTQGTIMIRPQPDVFELGPSASKTLVQDGAPPNNGSEHNDYTQLGRYVGAATVTSSNEQPLVVIVNQAFPDTDPGPFGTAYEGFNTDLASTRMSVPLVMANNNTYYTGIQVQNADAEPVQVTIKYAPNAATGIDPIDEPQSDVFTLQPGASKTLIHNDAPPANGSTVNDWGEIGTYLGAASITATGPIVAIVNEFTWGFAGDQFYTYTAINY
jgi:hypothetical protein